MVYPNLLTEPDFACTIPKSVVYSKCGDMEYMCRGIQARLEGQKEGVPPAGTLF